MFCWDLNLKTKAELNSILFSSCCSRLMALKRMGIVENYEVRLHIFKTLNCNTTNIHTVVVGVLYLYQLIPKIHV